MKLSFASFVRCALIFAVTFCVAYLAMRGVCRTEWFQERLYRQLIQGTPEQQLRAASTLADLNAERHLLRALQEETPSVHQLARRALDHVWFNAAGEEAYAQAQAAYEASEKKDYPKALELLSTLVVKYPRFAEAWNRRASVYWLTGEYEKSLRDCERALALKPEHYAAWQGVGVCQLQLGNVAEACRALRKALRIAPHDEATRKCLRQCEEMLRLFPNPNGAEKHLDLI